MVSQHCLISIEPRYTLFTVSPFFFRTQPCVFFKLSPLCSVKIFIFSAWLLKNRLIRKDLKYFEIDRPKIYTNIPPNHLFLTSSRLFFRSFVHNILSHRISLCSNRRVEHVLTTAIVASSPSLFYITVASFMWQQWRRKWHLFSQTQDVKEKLGLQCGRGSRKSRQTKDVGIRPLSEECQGSTWREIS